MKKFDLVMPDFFTDDTDGDKIRKFGPYVVKREINRTIDMISGIDDSDPSRYGKIAYATTLACEKFDLTKETYTHKIGDLTAAMVYLMDLVDAMTAAAEQTWEAEK